MMRFAVCTALAVLLLSPASARAQDALDARYASAYFAWQDGDYPRSLALLDSLLTAPGGERLHEPAALLTGELYRTVELARDGRAPRWSPDGRWAAYETRADDDGITTHLVRLDGARVVGRQSVRGRGLAFDAAGERAAYLTTPRSAAYRSARDSIVDAIEVTDRASFLARRRALARLQAEHARVVVRDLATGDERELRPRGLAGVYELVFAAHGGTLYVVGSPPADESRGTDIYAVDVGTGSADRLTRGAGRASGPLPVPGGRYLVYGYDDGIGLLGLDDGLRARFPGRSPAFAADGSALAWVVDAGDWDEPTGRTDVEPGAEIVRALRAALPEDETPRNAVVVLPLDGEPRPSIAVWTDDRIANPALSPDGRRVVYQRMPREDYELFVVDAAGENERRLTWEIGDDLFPRFVDDRRVFAVIGEGRHRRSFLHDLDALAAARAVRVAEDASPPAALPPPVYPTAAVRIRTRLFHNNTIRTIAPEYAWSVSPDGTRVLIVSDRDGDTISPERGLYLLDLGTRITRDELLARIRRMLDAETALRDWGERAYAPMADGVRAAVDDVSVSRIYEYERELFTYGSKFITRPGNLRAVDYLARTLESFGYDVELEWFEPRGRRSANVIATLRGTTNPELVYVVSSHFDSSSRGPGSDDNTSGTAALLETARVLADRPQPATIQLAFFTGEEAGLLGSREFVRRAVENGKRVVGALNNDMVGFANDQRLDNTIRYSNDGIRDLQHAAALQFTDLILYDARYYRSTDAHAYYEAYGDIVGGIGSHPVLSSPHYHEPHDVLEIVNHRLIAEVAKTTIASIMRLASSPARLGGLEVVRRDGDAVELRWEPAPERGVRRYVVAWGPVEDPTRYTRTVTEPRVRIAGVAPGTVASVKAVNARGLDGWDWARVEL